MADSGSMLTIGAFAKACRLSPKALRLYDELDLLRPARVDPDTGYRYYAAEQLEQARLVAWLRRLGMPLARIRTVRSLAPAPAAREIRAYWAEVEAETASRRELAAFLVSHLTDSTSSRKDTTMLELRYAALSDTGLVRPANQDTAYAGAHVLAVADGFGPAGAPASTAAVEALKTLDREPLPAGSMPNVGCPLAYAPWGCSLGASAGGVWLLAQFPAPLKSRGCAPCFTARRGRVFQ
ncbi:MerR family transcriptional regulator, partial [Streptomyces sp. NPDC002643]